MKHSLMGGLLLASISSVACLPCAHAQAQPGSSVTLYGIVDAAVEHITNVGAGGSSVTRMATLTGGQLPSRWGLRGAETLGGGYKAIFTLESGFAIDSGTQGQAGRAFGRIAMVGLDTPYGALTLGRQPTMLFWSAFDADVIGASAFSMASFDTYIPNARSDNTVAYRGTFSGLTVGATYSFGRDTSAAGNCAGESGTDTQACKAWSGMLKYDQANWGAALVYDEQRGGAGSVPVNVIPGAPGVALSGSANKDKRYVANGYVKISSLKIGGGWLHRRIEGSTQQLESNLYYLGASYPIGKWAIDAQAVRMQAGDVQARATMLIGRASYNFSRRTSAYAMLARMDNSGAGATYSVSSSSIVPLAPNAGGGQTGVMVGLRHAF